MKYSLEQLRQLLKKQLTTKRYEHTLRVEDTAVKLAERYHYDIEKTRIAALLHDCAKNIPHRKVIELCKEYHIELNKEEKENPDLLHAKLGAVLANKHYYVEDEDILQAIRCHTTGRANMSLLEKIIYIADYIEPGRDKAPNLVTIRNLCKQGINKGLLKILKDTVVYLKKKDKPIDPKTEEAYIYYKERKE